MTAYTHAERSNYAMSVHLCHMRRLRASRPSTSRGFTLVELLAVIAMVGILAALAVVGYRNYLNTARTAEAKAVLGAIRVAQESYRAETLSYLDVSTSMTEWYPQAPDSTHHRWTNPSHPRHSQWAMLNPATDSVTTFGFVVRAGGPGQAVHAPTTNAQPTWGVPTEPWYIMQAAGDADADGTFALLLAASFNGEIYVEQENE